jgi:hypothetical protein
MQGVFITKKLIGTAVLLMLMLGLTTATLSTVFAKPGNGNSCQARENALSHGNGNHYGILKHPGDCP